MPSSAETSAESIITALGLQPLDQEGGYFRRTAEAGLWVKPAEQIGGGDGDGDEARRAYSVIYALFTPEGFSAMHRLSNDEIWCWHAGDPLESLRLHADGSGEWVRLGANFAAGERPQDVVLAGVWQGTRLVPGGRWALVSCVLAPEFDWGDFELGERAELTAAYPNFGDGVTALTREEAPAGAR
ncbi:cupin domain-containing protein [Actomonas aquatica]|uniref:Cupin domain-containing protein n=1 Tax=Actomonas aquatica TaxID=2866162 RepID=A0ABZ1C873_9BACT|nr:cupin domain-containing protein [Opitutus sp. WL0086]WRQ87473.1 cupin domain-containing protein [Opitutus sp. WL0086]